VKFAVGSWLLAKSKAKRQKLRANSQEPLFAKTKDWSIDLRAELTSTAAPSAPVPMNAIWRTIRGYILWQYERGTLHYDIMVTLILLFIFISPRVINFNDKPIGRRPHPTDVEVTSDTEGRLLYQVAGGAISPGDDQAIREQLLRIIEPISGAVSIISYEAVDDHKGHIQGYKVLVKRD
jgi:hypothetical protein